MVYIFNLNNGFGLLGPTKSDPTATYNHSQANQNKSAGPMVLYSAPQVLFLSLSLIFCGCFQLGNLGSDGLINWVVNTAKESGTDHCDSWLNQIGGGYVLESVGWNVGVCFYCSRDLLAAQFECLKCNGRCTVNWRMETLLYYVCYVLKINILSCLSRWVSAF